MYGCTSWNLTKLFEKKLDRNYAKILETAPHKTAGMRPLSCRLGTVGKQESCDVPLHINKLVLIAKTCIHQLCVDSGCRVEKLPRAIAERDGSRELRDSVQSIRLDIYIRHFTLKIPLEIY